MKSYHVWHNPSKEDRPVGLELVVAPWYIILLDWIEEKITPRCWYLHLFPLPDELASWTRHWCGKDWEPMTFAEAFGGDWGDLWHYLACSYLNWAQNNPKRRASFIDVTESVVPDWPEFKWVREEIERNKKDDERLDNPPETALYRFLQRATDILRIKPHDKDSGQV